MNSPLCRACDRTTDAALCSPCADGLATALRAVPELFDDLQLTRIRADRLGDSGRGGERPLEYKDTASEALAVLVNTLGPWVRDIARSRGLTIAAPAPPRRPLRAIPPGARIDPEGRPAMDTSPLDPAVESARFAALWLAENISDIRAL